MLEAIADGLNTAVKNAKGKQRRPEFIKFVKAATTLASKTSVRGSAAGILAMAMVPFFYSYHGLYIH